METQYRKRKGIQQLLQSRHQIKLADFFNTTNDLGLGHFIDRIDVIDPFLLVQIALMLSGDGISLGYRMR